MAGCCYDNAAMESFWATLKTELIGGRIFDSHVQGAGRTLRQHRNLSNRARLHGALGYQSPVEYEANLSQTSHNPALRAVQVFGTTPG